MSRPQATVNGNITISKLNFFSKSWLMMRREGRAIMTIIKLKATHFSKRLAWTSFASLRIDSHWKCIWWRASSMRFYAAFLIPVSPALLKIVWKENKTHRLSNSGSSAFF